MLRKIFVYVFVLSLFVMPTFVLAIHPTTVSTTAVYYDSYTEQQLLDLIAKLQKQLEEIRNNVTKCNLAEVDLSVGDGEGGVNKSEVVALQAFLKEKGYFSLEPTGWFGKITRASLINFQTASGLTASGELDSVTRAHIRTLNCLRNKQVYKGEVKAQVKAEVKAEVKTETKTNKTTSSTGAVSSISLTGNGTSVSWSTTGYSKKGFKVVWSKNPNPTYPLRTGDQYIYLTDPYANNTVINAFDGSGTYYVRVCEYVGTCGVYSNEITVSL